MNWDDLKVFEAAASNGSLSAGASALGMSQPQMSRRLRGLEEKLGTRLFDRTPTGLRPTKAGTRLIPLAENMRRAAEDIVRVAPDLAFLKPMTVRITVDEIREQFLTSRLADLRSAIGDIPIEIFSDHEHPDHEARKTDIQIRSCLPESETLIAKRIGQTLHGLYIHESLLPDLSESSLASAPFVDFTPDRLWHPVQKRWIEQIFAKEPMLRVNTMTGMLNAVGAAQGCGVLPRLMADGRNDLREVQTKVPPPTTTEYLIVHRDLLRERAVRVVVDALTALYRNEQVSR